MTAIQEQRKYVALCDLARSLNLPVSLDDPRSPTTVDGLRQMVTNRVTDCLEIGMCGYCSSDDMDGTLCNTCGKHTRISDAW